MSATHHKDLRSGRSIWQSRRLSLPKTAALKADTKADLLVIGAGISGAMVAEQLSDEGFSVIMVDRRGALKGSTPASTALLQYEVDTPLSQLGESIGKERAQRIWRRSRLSLDALRERTRHLGIAADVQNRDSLYLDGNVLGADALAEEGHARREAGFEVSHLTKSQVKERFGISGRTALLGYDNMSADPRRLAAGFLKVAMARGVKVFSDTEIIAVEPSGDGVLAQTAGGQSVQCRHLIFATGYELPVGVPKKGHSIASTWALATKPQPANLWKGRELIWEASDPYLYLRVGPDGRIICGGEDEEFSDEDKRDALMPAKIAAIEGKLSKLMPWVDAKADYAWCGNFGASETGTPSIGPVPGMKNCFAVLGYGGNGITFSMMAAQMLRLMLSGRNDPDSDLFSFRRSF